MKRTAAILVLLVLSGTAGAADWPAWRGPTGQGLCEEKNLPLKWSAKENVKWKVPLADQGNSTPVIWGERVFVTQAIENRRTLMCFERAKGKLLWQSGTITDEKEPTHETNPYCSGSPVTDGERVIASFGTAGLFCYDFQGKELWHRDLGRQSHMWGVAASPVIYNDLCLLNFGPGERTFLIAVNKKTGATVWQHDEPGGKADKYIGSWSTPILIETDVRKELIMPWPERVVACDPKDGREWWSCRGLNPLVYTSALYADGIVVAMGGFNGSMLAVKTGGSGDVTTTHRLWQAPKTKQRIGSGVIAGDYVYIVDDPGVAECFELRTAKPVWETRLKGPGPKADNWSSLVLADNHLYAVNQSGDAFVFRANPKFEAVSTNSLGELTRSSIAVSDGELFIRTYNNLWCISGKK
jgi:outer membrane protein assembly factor BamB